MHVGNHITHMCMVSTSGIPVMTSSRGGGGSEYNAGNADFGNSYNAMGGKIPSVVLQGREAFGYLSLHATGQPYRCYDSA